MNSSFLKLSTDKTEIQTVGPKTLLNILNVPLNVLNVAAAFEIVNLGTPIIVL